MFLETKHYYMLFALSLLGIKTHLLITKGFFFNIADYFIEQNKVMPLS